MRNQWFIWALVAAVGVFVLFIFNYQGTQDSVSLSEIFPEQDEGLKTDNIEYEFVDAPKKSAPNEAEIPIVAQPKPQATQKPVVNQAKVQASAAQPQATAQSQTQAAVPAKAASVPAVQAKSAETTTSAAIPKPPPNIFQPSTAEPTTTAAATAAPSPKRAAIQSADSVSARFTIQIASFHDRESAEMTLKGIKAAGHPAYIVSKDLGAKGTWYRIYVGKYDTKEEANHKLSELKPAYNSSFVISP